MDGTFIEGSQIRSDGVAGRLYPGLGEAPRPGVLVLHGAGGAGGYERGYAALLAEHGFETLCVEYFDAPGVRDALLEVPLSEFDRAARWLVDRPAVAGDRVAVVGFSRGGEAALLAGAHFETVGAVVAYVPSGFAFPAPAWMDGVEEGRPAWTRDGEPVPFLPIDDYVSETDGIEEALGGEPPGPTRLALGRMTDDERERAAIEVERTDGPILLVSGGLDGAWPSMELAGRAADRLDCHNHSWPYEHRAYPEAGHAIRVPYRFDDSDDPDGKHWLGGTNEANARASADAWQATLRYLDPALREGGS